MDRACVDASKKRHTESLRGRADDGGTRPAILTIAAVTLAGTATLVPACSREPEAPDVPRSPDAVVARARATGGSGPTAAGATGPEGASADASTGRPSPPPSATASSAEPLPDRGSAQLCQAAGPFERFELAPGGWYSSAVGLAVRFEGASHDSFDDGRFDLWVKLTLWDARGSTPWLQGVLGGPVLREKLGRCVRIVEGGPARVVLEVAPALGKGASGAEARSVPSCSPPAADVLELKDYGDARDGARYHLLVARDATHGEWTPKPHPRFVHHVGARMEWKNLSEHPELASAQRERLRFTFDLVSRTVHAYPSRHRSGVEYAARITDVCRP